MPVPASSHRLAQLGRANSQRVDRHSFITNREHRGVQRVLMTADCTIEVWTYALDLARGLSAQGVETILATRGGSLSPAQRDDATQISGLTVCESDWEQAGIPGCADNLRRVGKWLLELETLYAPDVIHLNDSFHTVLPWRAPVLMVAHMHLLSWWQSVQGECTVTEWESYVESMRTTLHAAQQIVVPTWTMADALETLYGEMMSLSVISNGRDRSLYRKPAMEEHKEPIILTAGPSEDEAKNLTLLQQVAPSLPWPVFMAGESQPDNTLPVVDENKSIGEFVSLGLLTSGELANWYTRAAIYALPARYETSGLSALEAALSGCALVLGDIASLREVWGEAALYVTPDDPDALRETLQRLISDAAWRGRMSARAYQHAQRYSLEAMTQAYMEVYARLMAPLTAQHQARDEMD